MTAAQTDPTLERGGKAPITPLDPNAPDYRERKAQLDRERTAEENRSDPTRAARRASGGQIDQLLKEINRTAGPGLDESQTKTLIKRLENMRDDWNGVVRSGPATPENAPNYPQIPGPFIGS